MAKIASCILPTRLWKQFSFTSFLPSLFPSFLLPFLGPPCSCSFSISIIWIFLSFLTRGHASLGEFRSPSFSFPVFSTQVLFLPSFLTVLQTLSLPLLLCSDGHFPEESKASIHWPEGKCARINFHLWSNFLTLCP